MPMCGDDAQDQPLREEDVMREDKLDDRVEEGEGLPVEDEDE
jgi:hypothetical protein